MRTFKIYSLSNFQICNMVLLTTDIMLYITSSMLYIIYFITESLCLVTHFTHVAQPHHLPLATTYLFSVWMSLVYYKVISVCPFKTPLILSQFMILLLSHFSHCDPIDGSPLRSSVPGILQARILEWVTISFSNAWKWKVKVKSLSRVWLLATPWTVAYQASPSMGFSRQEYWSGVPLA